MIIPPIIVGSTTFVISISLLPIKVSTYFFIFAWVASFIGMADITVALAMPFISLYEAMKLVATMCSSPSLFLSTKKETKLRVNSFVFANTLVKIAFLAADATIGLLSRLVSSLDSEQIVATASMSFLTSSSLLPTIARSNNDFEYRDAILLDAIGSIN